MSTEKLNKIKKYLNQCFFLKYDEIRQCLDTVEYFPDQGQDELLKLLEDAQIKQDNLLGKTIKANKNFATNLKKFVTQTANRLKNKFEIRENSKADDILDQI